MNQGFGLKFDFSNSHLAHPLDIEEAGNEVTIGIDYSHVHIRWPNEVWETGNLWNDAMGVIDAILSERVYSLSGWIGGRLRVGSLREVGASTRLVVPNLESLRFRSWNGSLDKDEVIGNYSSEGRRS